MNEERFWKLEDKLLKEVGMFALSIIFFLAIVGVSIGLIINIGFHPGMLLFVLMLLYLGAVVYTRFLALKSTYKEYKEVKRMLE